MALELFNLPQAPGVVSVSFGWPEIDSCDSDVDRHVNINAVLRQSNCCEISSANCSGQSVAQWINRTNIELMKVGLRRKYLVHE